MSLELSLPEEQEVKEEVTKEMEIKSEEEIELEGQASKYVDELINVDLNDDRAKIEKTAAIDQMGLELQKESSYKNELLQEPLQKTAKLSEDGSFVADTILDLRETVNDLDPSKYDLEGKGILSKLFNPLKRYFKKYESSQESLDQILKSLDSGKDVLQRDNVSLEQEQIEMRALTIKLEKVIKMAQMMDKKFEEKIASELDESKKSFIQEELLFPLRQRIMDLQQQLAVNQQGIVAMEILRRNNKELVRGVDRAKFVTVNALKVAVIVAKALADQRLVLDQINSLNDTTNTLIENTSQTLKTQGAEIQKQASSAMLDVEKLKNAFQNIHETLDEISTFRKEALPKMSQTINELGDLTKRSEEAIQKMEKGELVREKQMS